MFFNLVVIFIPIVLHTSNAIPLEDDKATVSLQSNPILVGDANSAKSANNNNLSVLGLENLKDTQQIRYLEDDGAADVDLGVDATRYYEGGFYPGGGYYGGGGFGGYYGGYRRRYYGGYRPYPYYG